METIDQSVIGTLLESDAKRFLNHLLTSTFGATPYQALTGIPTKQSKLKKTSGLENVFLKSADSCG